MRVVLDTNVVVSAYLSPLGSPARVVQLVLIGKITPVLDERILFEYKEVLCRPRFQIPRQSIRWLIDYLYSEGEFVTADVLNIRLPDHDDLPFVEVAVSGRADCIVTGNIKDFQPTVLKGLGVKVLIPADLLKLI